MVRSQSRRAAAAICCRPSSTVPRTQDAWEIRFDQDEWDLKQPKEVKIIENGPERVVVRINHTFQSSTIQQDVIVYAGVPRIDVDTQVDWHENSTSF